MKKYLIVLLFSLLCLESFAQFGGLYNYEKPVEVSWGQNTTAYYLDENGEILSETILLCENKLYIGDIHGLSYYISKSKKKSLARC